MNRTGSTVVSRGFPAFSHEGQCGNHPFHQSVNVTFNRWKGMFDQSYCKHGPKRLARVFQSCESDAARAALFEMPAPLTGPSSPALVFVLIGDGWVSTSAHVHVDVGHELQSVVPQDAATPKHLDCAVNGGPRPPESSSQGGL